MTKLVIQIPCLDEAEHLPRTLAALPRRIDGIDEIEVLVIDDGSGDDTSGAALRGGAQETITGASTSLIVTRKLQLLA